MCWWGRSSGEARVWGKWAFSSLGGFTSQLGEALSSLICPSQQQLGLETSLSPCLPKLPWDCVHQHQKVL